MDLKNSISICSRANFIQSFLQLSWICSSCILMPWAIQSKFYRTKIVGVDTLSCTKWCKLKLKVCAMYLDNKYSKSLAQRKPSVYIFQESYIHRTRRAPRRMTQSSWGRWRHNMICQLGDAKRELAYHLRRGSMLQWTMKVSRWYQMFLPNKETSAILQDL